MSAGANKQGALGITDVADRLEQAAQTLRRMPKVKVRGHSSSWPDVIREFNEAYGYGEEMVRLGPPSARHITEMEAALRWLLWLDEDEVRLVWLRANNVRWKHIEKRLCWSISKLKLDWKASILYIATMLNEKPDSESYPYKKLLTNSAKNSLTVVHIL